MLTRHTISLRAINHFSASIRSGGIPRTFSGQLSFARLSARPSTGNAVARLLGDRRSTYNPTTEATYPLISRIELCPSSGGPARAIVGLRRPLPATCSVAGRCASAASGRRRASARGKLGPYIYVCVCVYVSLVCIEWEEEEKELNENLVDLKLRKACTSQLSC